MIYIPSITSSPNKSTEQPVFPTIAATTLVQIIISCRDSHLPNSNFDSYKSFLSAAARINHLLLSVNVPHLFTILQCFPLIQNKRQHLYNGPKLCIVWTLCDLPASSHTLFPSLSPLRPTVSLLFSKHFPDTLVSLQLCTCCSLWLKLPSPKYPYGLLLYLCMVFTQMTASQWVITIHTA